MTSLADYFWLSDWLLVQSNAPGNPAIKSLWMDTSNPAAPVLRVYMGPPQGWVISGGGGGGGAALPPATRQGQVLVAGAAPTFPWAAGDVDCGRF